MKTKDHNKRMFARRAAMTLLAAVMTTMAWAQNPATIGSIRYNAALGAYEINSVANLNDLAVYVSGMGQYKNGNNEYTYSDGTPANGLHDCAGMTFKMTADITFPHLDAGEEGADTEDNFTPIGIVNKKSFCGHFDGYDPTDNSSHTISGIRINSDILTSRIGLFGCLGSGARVEGVTLADAAISGNSSVGGIAGDNRGGTVTHCTVSKSVAIYGHLNLGGIVGNNTKDANDNLGIISHCTSSVQISLITGSTSCKYTGGIVGYNIYGSLTDNLAIEATVHGSSNYYHGAIAGINSKDNKKGEIARNYYRHCTVAGVENAIGKGLNNNDTNGALPLHSLTTPTGVTATTVSQPIQIADEDNDLYPSGTKFTLSGGLDDLDTPAPGYMKGYTTTAGTVVGSTTSGFTLTLSGGDATIGTTSRFLIDWAVESTGDDADHAYLIYNAEQLDLVARRVNDDDTRSTYSGKYYRLMNDIDYSTDNTDNNYTPIGTYYSNSFRGHFDGGSHFVSGIRINKPNNSYLGLFGYLGDGSTVSNVIVSDARITGGIYVGCIAGYAGNNTLTANYYHDCSCTVGDAATAITTSTGIGCNGADITDNDGAMPVFSLTVPTGVTATPDTQPIRIADEDDDLYPSGTVFTLSGGLDDLDDPAPGYMKGYTTTAGTLVGSATSGFTLTLHGGDATIGTTNRFTIDWADESTGDDADHAYLIYNADQLDLVARRINDPLTRGTYSEKYYRLAKDIKYSTDNTDNNYTPIGRLYYTFVGHFDGGGHTVSGIRINRPDDSYLGLFGYFGKGSTVSNVIVSDARITGSSYVGCIAGYSDNSILTANYYYNCSCTVEGVVKVGVGIGCNGADITDNDGAVPVFYISNERSEITIQPDPVFTVGNLGYYKPGTVITLSGQPDNTPVDQYYKYCLNGQVVDGNSFTMPTYNVSVQFENSPIDLPCVTLASGITATPTPFKSDGTCNYYIPGTTITLSGGLPEAPEGYCYAYTVNGEIITGNSFDVPSFDESSTVTVGVSSDPIFDPDMLVLYDDRDNSEAIAAAARSRKAYNVMLLGHTLYKDGRWNPLCLPFDVELEGALEGFDVVTPSYGKSGQGCSQEKILLYFTKVNRIKAGVPYFVRCNNSDDTENIIVSPLFRQVRISAAQPSSLTTNKASGDENDETYKTVTYLGNYSPVTFTSAFKNVLFMEEGSTLGAFRAYLKIDSDEDLPTPSSPDRVFGGWTDWFVSKRVTDITELLIYDCDFSKLYPLWVAFGDVNGDGSITPADAIMILYHYFGVAQKGFIKAAADINGDNTISPADAIEALYKYFGTSAGARSSSPANPRDPD